MAFTRRGCALIISTPTCYQNVCLQSDLFSQASQRCQHSLHTQLGSDNCGSVLKWSCLLMCSKSKNRSAYHTDVWLWLLLLKKWTEVVLFTISLVLLQLLGCYLSQIPRCMRTASAVLPTSTTTTMTDDNCYSTTTTAIADGRTLAYVANGITFKHFQCS